VESYKSLAHSRYDCKYHVVFVPKFRKKTLYGKIRKYLKDVFHELAKQKGCEIVSGHMAGDHVHMCISIPQKYAVSEVRFKDCIEKGLLRKLPASEDNAI
jgi:putative transposase